MFFWWIGGTTEHRCSFYPKYSETEDKCNDSWCESVNVIDYQMVFALFKIKMTKCPFNTLKTQAALLGVMVRSSAVDKKKLKTQSSEIFNLTNLGLRFSRPLCLCSWLSSNQRFQAPKIFFQDSHPYFPIGDFLL